MQDALLFCGIVSPILYVSMTILGGRMRPGYSHMHDTVSELFSPGSPNKRLLDRLHMLSAICSVLFGVGLVQIVTGADQSNLVGLYGALCILGNGALNIATASVFPQDPIGSQLTVAGKMHIVLVAVMALLSVTGMILLGWWLRDSGLAIGFGGYSLVSAAVLGASGVFTFLSAGKLPLGLTERLSVAVYLQWSVVMAMKFITL